MSHAVPSDKVLLLDVVIGRCVMSFLKFIALGVPLSFLLLVSCLLIISVCFITSTAFKCARPVSLCIFIFSKLLISSLCDFRIKLILYCSVCILDFQEHSFRHFIAWIHIRMIFFGFLIILQLDFLQFLAPRDSKQKVGVLELLIRCRSTIALRCKVPPRRY